MIPGIDDSTDRLRLIPKLPNPPTWRAIFMVGHPKSTTVGVDVRQSFIIGRGDADGDALVGLDLSAYHAVQQGVSRQHAVLIPTPEGLLVSDLGSTNGTWVNGEYLEPGSRHELSPGDQIELGLLRLVVRSVALVSRAAG
jgi:pSer/pThr/pTyr-binding forkhead associated (FHA) protein